MPFLLAFILLSAEQLRIWLVARGSSSFSGQVITPTGSGFELEFSINVNSFVGNLYAMIPYEALGGRVTSIVRNPDFRIPVEFTIETIKGRSYAVFRAGNGNAVAHILLDKIATPCRGGFSPYLHGVTYLQLICKANKYIPSLVALIYLV
jgi:hypothetical protein